MTPVDDTAGCDSEVQLFVDVITQFNLVCAAELTSWITMALVVEKICQMVLCITIGGAVT